MCVSDPFQGCFFASGNIQLAIEIILLIELTNFLRSFHYQIHTLHQIQTQWDVILPAL